MTRIYMWLVVLGVALAVQGCCCGDGGNTEHKLSECGIRLTLPNHFNQPKHGSGCDYEWTANHDETTLRITSALPGDKGTNTKKKTAMTGQRVDYARKAKFGNLSGRERRTQGMLGPRNRAVWTGFVKGPKGNLDIKLTMLQEFSADEFGESFWQNIRTHWVKPL